jgi:hypothetical protein
MSTLLVAARTCRIQPAETESLASLVQLAIANGQRELDLNAQRRRRLSPRDDVEPAIRGDLYRAIHLVVAVVDRVMKIQIMSARREVVCECDHSIVFKKTVPPVTPFHVEWLRQLSRAANLGDALSDIQDDGHPKKI